MRAFATDALRAEATSQTETTDATEVISQTETTDVEAAVEADANETYAVTINSSGEGKIIPAPEPLEVPAGTEYKVNGNTLAINDKSYTATVNKGFYFYG